MSEADKMFEELGYLKEVGRSNNLDIDYIKYTKNIFEDETQDIVFDLEHNLLNTTREDRGFYRTITTILNVQELKAINKKVEELGWN